MSNFVLNSFPAIVTPNRMLLPYVECPSWEHSTDLRRLQYKQYRTYRYKLKSQDDATGKRGPVRLVLLSGPDDDGTRPTAEFDLAEFPNLGANLIEHTLSCHLESRGFAIKRTRFEWLALQRSEASGQLIHLHSGISFQARRPFAEKAYAFTLSAQWVARAMFADSLQNKTLRELAPGLAVLYTPKGKPLADLQDYESHYLGRVKEIVPPAEAIVGCRDNAVRRVPLGDLTLEASPEAIRRYEQKTGSSHQPMRVWRRLQQLSQVLTPEGRRNTGVLRNRLEAIRNLLGGASKEQLILPLDCYQNGSVSIGLTPVSVEFSA